MTLWTRSGLDWTARFPTIAQELTGLSIKQAWLDGEIVAEDERGISSFQSLQNALANNDDRKLIYYVFDLPWAEGRDLSSLRLIERKQILKALLVPTKKRNSELFRRGARPVARITIFFSTCATTITSSVLAPMYWAVLAICNWKALFPNAVAASINIAAQMIG